MTFQEYLAQLPLDDLKLIASTLRISSDLISRARLLREIPEHILQPGFVETRVDALDPAEQDTLLAVLTAGEKGYDYDTGGATDPGLTDRLYHLLCCGLVMSRRAFPHGAEFVVAVDLRERLNRHLARKLTACLAFHAPAPPPDESDTLAFIRDLFSFLTGVRREPPRLTDRGTLYKRAVETILGRFESKDRHTSLAGMEYPDRFDLMIHYARSRRLIHEEEDRLRLSGSFEHWLHLPTNEKADDLLAFWYGRNSALSGGVDGLLSVLQIGIDMEAMHTEALKNLVLTCTSGLAVRERTLSVHRERVDKALRELEWMGLIRRYTEENAASSVLSLTPLGRNVLGNRPWEEEGLWADRFVIQPTYEIIAPRTLHLAIRDELERFSDLASVDVALTFRITRDTVYRGGDEGVSGEAILTFLERHSEKAIPQNVEYSIREWGDTYGQVYFMDVFLLRTATAEIATHIKAHRDLAPFVRGEVAPDALIVERHRYREMLEGLRKAGFMPKHQIAGAEPEPERGRQTFARERFTDLWTRHGPHRPTHTVMGFDDCLPGYRIRQRMGVSTEVAAHLRPGRAMTHLSPKHTEELLRVAIERQQAVLIEYYTGNRNNTEMQKIRPIRVEQTRGTPYVEAQRVWEQDKRAFRVAQIRAIRIVGHDEEE
ncbi:MAG: helicase-associated domain-containing protein [candidate division Zixibacteria bacterium]|nr:helicase-associated domain-containing protein [candidate division Zixibacteria bacterium]